MVAMTGWFYDFPWLSLVTGFVLFVAWAVHRRRSGGTVRSWLLLLPALVWLGWGAWIWSQAEPGAGAYLRARYLNGYLALIGATLLALLPWALRGDRGQ